MKRVLVVYASNHGQTRKIARRIAEVLTSEGLETDVREVGDASDADPASYDGVVVGASVHAAHHQREIVAWVAERAGALAGRPSAYFSVSLSAASDDTESKRSARGYVDNFLDETRWRPTLVAPFAGAIQYREYGLITRAFVRATMALDGKTTDTSRNHDFTDWAEVEGFAHRIADAIHAPGRGGAAPERRGRSRRARRRSEGASAGRGRSGDAPRDDRRGYPPVRS